MHKNVYLSYNEKPSIPTPIFRLDSPPCLPPTSEFIPSNRRVHSCEELLSYNTQPQEFITITCPWVELYPTNNFTSYNEECTEEPKSSSCCEESNDSKAETLSKLFTLVRDFQYYCMTKNQSYKYEKRKRFPRLFNNFGQRSCYVEQGFSPRRECSSREINVRYNSYYTSSDSSYEDKYFDRKKEKSKRNSSRSEVRTKSFKNKSSKAKSTKEDRSTADNLVKIGASSKKGDEVMPDEDDSKKQSLKGSNRTDNRVTFFNPSKRQTITTKKDPTSLSTKQPQSKSPENDSKTYIKVATNGSNVSVQYSGSKNQSKTVKISTFDNSKTPLMDSKKLKTSTPNKEITEKSEKEDGSENESTRKSEKEDGSKKESTRKNETMNESTTLKLESTKKSEKVNESENNRRKSYTDQTSGLSQRDSLEPSYRVIENKLQKDFETKSNNIKVKNDSGTQFPETIISAKRLNISVGTSPSSMDRIATKPVNSPKIFSQYKSFDYESKKLVDDDPYFKNNAKDWNSKYVKNDFELPDYDKYIKSLYDTITRCRRKDDQEHERSDEDSFFLNPNSLKKNRPQNDSKRYSIKNHPNTLNLKSSLKRSSRDNDIEAACSKSIRDDRKVSIVGNVADHTSDEEVHNVLLKHSRSASEHGSREHFEVSPKESSYKQHSKPSLKRDQTEHSRSDQKYSRKYSEKSDRSSREHWSKRAKDNFSDDGITSVKMKMSQASAATQYSDEDLGKSKCSSKNSSIHETLSRADSSTQYSYEMIKVPKQKRSEDLKIKHKNNICTSSETKKSEKKINLVSTQEANKSCSTNTKYSANVKSSDPFMVVYVPKTPRGAKVELDKAIAHGIKRALEESRKCSKSLKEITGKKPTKSEIDVLTDSKLRL